MKCMLKSSKLLNCILKMQLSPSSVQQVNFLILFSTFLKLYAIQLRRYTIKYIFCGIQIIYISISKEGNLEKLPENGMPMHNKYLMKENTCIYIKD